MARERMVSRTIESTEVACLCCDITTAETTVMWFTLSGAYTDTTEMLKLVKKHYETDTLKIVVVNESYVNEELYGMPEVEFMRYAVKLDPVTRKPM